MKQETFITEPQEEIDGRYKVEMLVKLTPEGGNSGTYTIPVLKVSCFADQVYELISKGIETKRFREILSAALGLCDA